MTTPRMVDPGHPDCNDDELADFARGDACYRCGEVEIEKCKCPDHDPSICTQCGGSGGGPDPALYCSGCGGTGEIDVEPAFDDDDYDEPYLECSTPF